MAKCKVNKDKDCTGVATHIVDDGESHIQSCHPCSDHAPGNAIVETISKATKNKCCCGATEKNPCACMKKGIMKCSAKEPMCQCYKDLKKQGKHPADLKKAKDCEKDSHKEGWRYCGESDCVSCGGGVKKSFEVAWVSMIKSDEKGDNAPTNPGLWAQAKSKARTKFKVYPSAYANGWASKWYKSKGGGWKKKGKKK